jgi:23S rRNA pseudouridine1911/1915/1917 synthase
MGRYEGIVEIAGIVTADRATSAIAGNTGDEPIRAALRLDVYAASVLGLLTRSQIKLRNLTATVNGKTVRLSHPVKRGDRIALSWDERPPPDLPPENIPLSVIYEDAACVVLNKAQGMVVHPGAGNYRGTLVNALLWRQMTADRQQTAGRAEQPFIVYGDRPFIVHRLDKDTSGVLIAAYTEEALRFLSGQFKERAVKKTYAAIVVGAPPRDRGLIDTNLCRDPRNRKTFMVSGANGTMNPPSGGKGKRAVTRYQLIRSTARGGGVYSLLLLRPHTGRTHQLRVHLRHLGCPILGDPLYYKKDPRFPDATLMLHALSLEITLPHGERRTFKAPLPERFSLVSSPK